jgi:hypothetical protein
MRLTFLRHPHSSESNDFRHGLFIPTRPGNGTITFLLLQPRPEARQPPAWPLLAAPEQHSGPNLPPTCAANAFDPDLFQTKLVVLATHNAPAHVQRWIPDQHDANGFPSSNVPKAHHLDPGPLATIDNRLGLPRGRHVLLPFDTTVVCLWQRHEQPIQL